MPQTLGLWGDGGTWGHSTPNEFWNSPSLVFTRREALFDEAKIHQLAIQFNYSGAANLVPRLSNVSVLVKVQPGQQESTHQAVVDQTIGVISVQVNHGGGTDFVISHLQLLIQQEKQRPRG